MAANLSVTVTGAKEWEQALSTLGIRTQRKILTPALRKAADVVAKQARRNAPVRKGLVKRSIRIKNGKRRKDGVTVRVVVAGAYRGPTSYVGPLELGHRIGIGGRISTQSRQQQGTILDSRGYVAPRPFLRLAAHANTNTCIRIIEERIKLGIATEAAVGTLKTP